MPHNPDEGFELTNELLVLNPNIKILVLSEQGEKANVQHASTLVTVDFIPKPCDIPLLKTRLQHQIMILEADEVKGGGELNGENLIWESMEIKTLHTLIEQFTDTVFPVLIQGEPAAVKD